MRTLLLVTLFLCLTNVTSMRRIENRASCKKKAMNRILTYTELPTCLGGKQKRSFLQIPLCNQETALQVFTALQGLFCSSWCFCCKAEVIDITMGMLCCWARQAQSDVVLIYWFSWHFPSLHRLRQHVRKYLMLSAHTACLYKPGVNTHCPCLAFDVGWRHRGDLGPNASLRLVELRSLLQLIILKCRIV